MLRSSLLLFALNLLAVNAHKRAPHSAKHQSIHQAVNNYVDQSHNHKSDAQVIDQSTKQAPKQRYEPNWASLDTRPLPEWYDDAKFGIFIHWGVYSVPSWAPVGQYAEWYWYHLTEKDDDSETYNHHKAIYGDAKYQDFANQFKAELFNASEWADLFKRSGAKYTVPTSKHHEGFTLWPNAQSWNWNSVDVGPHRDLLGEIMNATRSAGLHAGVYFSLLDWYNPTYLANITQYVDQVMYPQWMDLINNYQPDVLWCDGNWPYPSKTWRSEEFLAWAFNDSPVKDTLVVDDRFGSETPTAHGSFYTPEYSTSVYLNHKWEANLGMDIHSYGFNRATPADKYYNASYLLNYLVRSVSNGGNMLLDIGPSSDGTIPSIMQERLLQMGDWLSVNGEAIYSTRKWRVQQEGPIDQTSVRYTASKDQSIIYALLIDWPHNGIVLLPSVKVNTQNATVSMLGLTGNLSWKTVSSGGISVQLPNLTPGTEPCLYIWTLKLVGFA